MKIVALLGAASLAIGGIAAAPAEAQYHHGYHGGYRGHGHGYRHRAHYRGGYGYRGFRHYGHRRVCNRFGRCHRI